ncbi:MAG: hypothetical protein BMS9Abin02_1459 [Anaerolineae bacterium]|nr:MAG: hypothetical protein BMS9Abin02_1459 [Anaerolineae bacterium]
MRYRGLCDPKGELFAYLDGLVLYSLDDQQTGRLEGDYIVDLEGNRVWRIYNDGVYSLDSMEAVGYLSDKTPEDR